MRSEGVSFDRNCRREAAVDTAKGADLLDRPGYRAVQARRHEATRLCDQLATLYAFSGRDDGAGRHTDVLAEWHDVIFAERHALNCQVFGLLFVMRWMNPVFEAATQAAKDAHHFWSRFCAASCNSRLRILLAISAWVCSLIWRISASKFCFCASSSDL